MHGFCKHSELPLPSPIAHAHKNAEEKAFLSLPRTALYSRNMLISSLGFVLKKMPLMQLRQTLCLALDYHIVMRRGVFFRLQFLQKLWWLLGWLWY